MPSDASTAKFFREAHAIVAPENTVAVEPFLYEVLLLPVKYCVSKARKAPDSAIMKVMQ